MENGGQDLYLPGVLTPLTTRAPESRSHQNHAVRSTWSQCHLFAGRERDLQVSSELYLCSLPKAFPQESDPAGLESICDLTQSNFGAARQGTH